MDEKKQNTGRTVLIVIIVLMSGLTGFFVLGSAVIAISNIDRGAYLIVEQVYFESKEVGNDLYDLEVKAYVTNDGDRSCDVRVSVFAKEMESNLVYDSDSKDLGSLKGRSTVKTGMIVSIDSMRRYLIEVLVYKDGKVVVRGSGTVNLREAGTGARDYKTDERDIPPPSGSIFNDAGGAATRALPFPALGLTLVAIAICVFFFRRWRR
jgi:hypothetical protein